MSDPLVTTSEFWPRIARIFGLDESGKHITRLTLVVEQPIPVVRVEMVVSNGQALALDEVLQEYELHKKLCDGETAEAMREAA